MRESQFQTKLLKALRAHPALKDAVIWKHSDRFNAGVPDFSISIGPRTIWFEVKVDPYKPTKLQAYYLNKLDAGAALIIAKKNGYVYCRGGTHTFEVAVREIVYGVVNQ